MEESETGPTVTQDMEERAERTMKYWFYYTDDRGRTKLEQSNNLRKLKEEAKALRLRWVDIHIEIDMRECTLNFFTGPRMTKEFQDANPHIYMETVREMYTPRY